MADANKPYTFNPPTVPQPPPTYDQVAITPLTTTSKLITLAGQVGIDPKTGGVPSDFLSQVRIAYENLENALAAANATPRDIIHVRHYIVQDSQNAKLNQLDILDRGYGSLWMEFLDEKGSGHRPPDTVLGVTSLAKAALLYEVECWAIISPF